MSEVDRDTGDTSEPQTSMVVRKNVFNLDKKPFG